MLEELETELTGDPIEIAFNAKYITDVIRNITDEKLCMRFNSNVSPCVIAPQEGEDYLYLILRCACSPNKRIKLKKTGARGKAVRPFRDQSDMDS